MSYIDAVALISNTTVPMKHMVKLVDMMMVGLNLMAATIATTLVRDMAPKKTDDTRAPKLINYEKKVFNAIFSHLVVL